MGKKFIIIFSNIFLHSIKYIFLFLLYSYIVLNGFLYSSNNDKKRDLIEIDNELKLNTYENETNFGKNQVKFKAISFYYPEFNNISYYKYFNCSKKANMLDFYDILNLVNAQVKFAKRHNIYGFAIFFNLFKSNYLNNLTINIFLNKVSFPFFLIWKNDEIKSIDRSIIVILINDIKKYLTSKSYIVINKKPILSIENPYKFKKKNIILMIRKEAQKEIGKIFIVYPFTKDFKQDYFLREFDATYDYSKINLFNTKNRTHFILYYSGIIYKNLILNNLQIDFPLFRTCNLNYKKYDDYNPEKFYISNKIIFNFLNTRNNKNYEYIFIDAWNNYKNGDYLEFDEKYGYSSINSFSKSILNMPFKINDFYMENRKTLIAVHIHVFYEDLIMEIINKINMIPFKYDLFISTTSKEKKRYIEKCLVNSTITKYEIKTFENRGRDILPFITQMKTKFKKYKYIGHFHTKKSVHKDFLGNNWRDYIYSNLLGSKEIISEIFFDFEKFEKLGFIFPEAYYDIIKNDNNFGKTNFFLHLKNKNYMNFILKSIFKRLKVEVGKKLIFPVGNMFWSKMKSIYQIFKTKFEYPKELNQTNETIMHAIERIWLYLVKLNGYYFKVIFKYY